MDSASQTRQTAPMQDSQDPDGLPLYDEFFGAKVQVAAAGQDEPSREVRRKTRVQRTAREATIELCLQLWAMMSPVHRQLLHQAATQPDPAAAAQPIDSSPFSPTNTSHVAALVAAAVMRIYVKRHPTSVSVHDKGWLSKGDFDAHLQSHLERLGCSLVLTALGPHGVSAVAKHVVATMPGKGGEGPTWGRTKNAAGWFGPLMLADVCADQDGPLLQAVAAFCQAAAGMPQQLAYTAIQDARQRGMNLNQSATQRSLNLDAPLFANRPDSGDPSCVQQGGNYNNNRLQVPPPHHVQPTRPEHRGAPFVVLQPERMGVRSSSDLSVLSVASSSVISGLSTADATGGAPESAKQCATVPLAAPPAPAPTLAPSTSARPAATAPASSVRTSPAAKGSSAQQSAPRCHAHGVTLTALPPDAVTLNSLGNYFHDLDAVRANLERLVTQFELHLKVYKGLKPSAMQDYMAATQLLVLQRDMRTAKSDLAQLEAKARIGLAEVLARHRIHLATHAQAKEALGRPLPELPAFVAVCDSDSDNEPLGKVSAGAAVSGTKRPAPAVGARQRNTRPKAALPANIRSSPVNIAGAGRASGSGVKPGTLVVSQSTLSADPFGRDHLWIGRVKHAKAATDAAGIATRLFECEFLHPRKYLVAGGGQEPDFTLPLATLPASQGFDCYPANLLAHKLEIGADMVLTSAAQAMVRRMWKQLAK